MGDRFSQEGTKYSESNGPGDRSFWETRPYVTVNPLTQAPITHVGSLFGVACEHLPRSHPSAAIVLPISLLSTVTLDGHSPTSLVPVISAMSQPKVKLPKLSIKKFHDDMTK